MGYYSPFRGRKWLWLILVLVLSACVAPVKYQAAVPQLPSGIQGQVHNDLIELELPNIKLYAQLQAFNWDGQYLLPPLGLWLNIAPLTKKITFNTVKVTLLSDGDLAPVISYLGPGVAWFSPRALAAGCGPRFYRTGIGLTRFGASQESVLNADNNLGIYRPTEKMIAIENTSCFMFWFDTDSLPDHNFTLIIDGLAQNGEKIKIPTLRFEKGTIKQLRTFP